MAARRVTVAYQQVETTPMRHFRCMQTGVWDLRRMPIMQTRHDELREDGMGLGYYWCAADKPATDDTANGLWVKRIYLTTVVPELASCEVCGTNIRELQEFMRQFIRP